MGMYFKSEEVVRVGRVLDNDKINRASYKNLTAQLRPGEKLTATYSNGLWIVCPNLSSQKELSAFEDQLMQGSYIERSFYAVTFEPV